MSTFKLTARTHTGGENARAVAAIYALERKPAFSLAVSGGGMQAIPMFLGVPGASACVIDAVIPYSRAATESFLSDNSDQVEDSTNCTKETALRMAKAAYVKTCKLLLHGEGGSSENTVDVINKVSSIFGVACTAALVSAVPKKGDHRVHVGIYSNSTQGDVGTTYSVTLTKGTRDRSEEDEVCSRLILDVISQHVGLPPLPDSLLLQVLPSSNLPQLSEKLQVTNYCASDALHNVTARVSKHALYFCTGTSTETPYTCLENAILPAGSLIYPGSFNPLHDGHLALVRAQLDLLEKRHFSRQTALNRPEGVFRPPLVVFEIGAVNADKPPLSRDEIMKRLAQFNAHTNPIFDRWGVKNFAVSVTSEPLYVGKANIFPSCDFLIGADTMVRLINSKYYVDKPKDGSGVTDTEDRRVANMVAALSTIAANKCRFVVGGRVKSVTNIDGQTESSFETCETILNSEYMRIIGASAGALESANSRVVDVLPGVAVDLFVNLTEEQFRLDLSSTELRNRGLTLPAANIS